MIHRSTTEGDMGLVCVTLLLLQHTCFFPGEIKPEVGSPLVKAFVCCCFSVQSVTLA